MVQRPIARYYKNQTTEFLIFQSSQIDIFNKRRIIRFLRTSKMYSPRINFLLIFFVSFCVIVTQIQESSSECCYSQVHKCCSEMKCDILCCNCEGGCKKSDEQGNVCRSSLKNYTFSSPEEAIKYSPSVDSFFPELDPNSDGKATKSEVNAYILWKFPGHKNAEEVYSFDDLDKKHKGFLTPEDIDVDYHKYSCKAVSQNSTTVVCG